MSPFRSIIANTSFKQMKFDASKNMITNRIVCLRHETSQNDKPLFCSCDVFSFRCKTKIKPCRLWTCAASWPSLTETFLRNYSFNKLTEHAFCLSIFTHHNPKKTIHVL